MEIQPLFEIIFGAFVPVLDSLTVTRETGYGWRDIGVWRATNIAFRLPRHSQMQPFPTKMFSKFPKILNFKDESMILKALKPIVSSYYEWWGITQSVFGFIFYFLLFYWFEVGGALLVKGENTNCLNFLTLIVAYSIMNTSCLLKNI